MSTPHEEREVRIAKMHRIESLGVSVRPQTYQKSYKLADLIARGNETFRTIDTIITQPESHYSTAGRIVLQRSFGKLLFAHLQDDSGRLQILFSREYCRISVHGQSCSEVSSTTETLTAYKFAEKLLDMGDFIGVRGELFHTQTGELTLFVSEFTFLGKALRPLPEKFHGIAEEETRYRQRYLDLITSTETMERFRFRSEFIRLIRRFYYEQGFIEIEWQTLTNTPTGAAARPYVTHQHALDMPVYLRIAHEIPLKLLNIAGMEKIFELGKAFRNEGQDPTHLPEHTHLEHNCSYWTYRENMTFTQQMFDYLFDHMGLARRRHILSKTNERIEVDFTTPWRQVDYVELVRGDCGIDVSIYDDVSDLRRDIRAKGIEIAGMDDMGLTTLIDYLYKKVSRPKLINPTLLYNYPIKLKPFARRNDENPNIADAFQLVINGWELVNAYSELVDPIDQAERFREGNEALASGDEEAVPWDEEFIKAMEYGMPPISGWGIGIDRIIALLTEQNNLRDIVLFPLLKPEDATKSLSTKEAEELYRSKKLAIVANPEYGAGIVANATAHTAIMIREHHEQSLVGATKTMHGHDGFVHRANCLYPIANLAGTQTDIVRVMRDAEARGLLVVDFSEIMLRAHKERDLVEGYAKGSLDDTPIIACGIFGVTKEVEEVVKGLGLYGK